jgi:hypothetical protein
MDLAPGFRITPDQQHRRRDVLDFGETIDSIVCQRVGPQLHENIAGGRGHHLCPATRGFLGPIGMLRTILRCKVVLPHCVLGEPAVECRHEILATAQGAIDDHQTRCPARVFRCPP